MLTVLIKPLRGLHELMGAPPTHLGKKDHSGNGSKYSYDDTSYHPWSVIIRLNNKVAPSVIPVDIIQQMQQQPSQQF
jgi:hypothetical protein